MKKVYKASNKYGLDPRELIIASSKRSVVNVPEELVMSMAEELKEKEQKKKAEITIRKIEFENAEDVLNAGERAKKIALELFSLSKNREKEHL